MANNRMVLACTACAKAVSIAKFYPTLEGLQIHKTVSSMNEFLERHRHLESGEDPLAGPVHFVLDFENRPQHIWVYEHLAGGVPRQP